jgi:hypothetical protein
MATPPNFTDLARSQRSAVFNKLSFNGLNYGNSTATVNLSNIILDSTVTAVNSSSNMVYSNTTIATAKNWEVI